MKQLIYEYIKDLVEEERFSNIHKTKRFNDLCFIDESLIFESEYFSEVPNDLQQYIVNIFTNMYDSKISSKYISIKEIAKYLLNNKIKNFKNFHNFLNVLTEANGKIELKFSTENSYYETPIIVQPIKIFDQNISPFDLAKIDENYKIYLNSKLNQIKTANKLYEQLFNLVKYQDNWGIINVNILKYDKLSIIVCHELSHLIKFLIRVSGINYNYCRYWSSIPHNDFDSYHMTKIEYENYLLDSDEFKSLAETYITLIKNHYNNNIENKSKETLQNYLYSIFKDSNLPYIPKKYLNEVNTLTNKLDITNFIQSIYKESKLDKSNHNKWTVFKKWLNNSFKH